MVYNTSSSRKQGINEETTKTTTTLATTPRPMYFAGYPVPNPLKMIIQEFAIGKIDRKIKIDTITRNIVLVKTCSWIRDIVEKETVHSGIIWAWQIDNGHLQEVSCDFVFTYITDTEDNLIIPDDDLYIHNEKMFFSENGLGYDVYDRYHYKNENDTWLGYEWTGRLNCFFKGI